MANAIYPKYKQALLTGDSNIDIESGTVKVALVDTGTYTYNAAHDFYDDVSAGVVGVSGHQRDGPSGNAKRWRHFNHLECLWHLPTLRA
jgi:hypothetical protein